MLKAPQDDWKWAKTAWIFPKSVLKDDALYGLQTDTDRYKFPRSFKNTKQRFQKKSTIIYCKWRIRVGIVLRSAQVETASAKNREEQNRLLHNQGVIAWPRHRAWKKILKVKSNYLNDQKHSCGNLYQQIKKPALKEILITWNKAKWIASGSRWFKRVSSQVKVNLWKISKRVQWKQFALLKQRWINNKHPNA